MLWDWSANERDPDGKKGRRVGFQTEGPQQTPEQLLTHCRTHYHWLDYSEFRAEPAAKLKLQTRSMNPDYFQYGILKAVEAELRGTGNGILANQYEEWRGRDADRPLRGLPGVRGYRAAAAGKYQPVRR